MPTRSEVNTSINALISKSNSLDKITDVEHRQANQEILDYVDQQDAAGGVNGTAELSSTGSATVTIPHVYKPGSIKVYRNGIRIPSSSITEATTTTITLSPAPDSGDYLIIDFKY